MITFTKNLRQSVKALPFVISSVPLRDRKDSKFMNQSLKVSICLVVTMAIGIIELIYIKKRSLPTRFSLIIKLMLLVLFLISGAITVYESLLLLVNSLSY